MKIIILGAGQVGTTLAEHLATEHNDITVIDSDADRLRSLQERLDISTISGNAAYPTTLRRGGAEEADLLVAVTSSDETNLVACQVASTLFQIPTKIARVRSLNYLAHEELFGVSGFPIDVLISPEQMVSNYIGRLIKYRDALQVLEFSHQKLQLLSVKITSPKPSMVGKPIKALSGYLPNNEVEIAAIFRDGKPMMPTSNTHILLNDEVLFLTDRSQVKLVLNLLIPVSPPNERITIAGGGNIGTRLATALEKEFQIKVIEKNPTRVETLATQLTTGIVLQGDACDKDLLLSENIENTDVFCAVTNQDETNIMSALLAKKLGAQKTIALINRPSYHELVEGRGIDIVLSPQQITIGSLLAHVRRGHMVNVHSLKHGTAEAIELFVDGNQYSSKIVGHHLKDIPLPAGAHIIALVRDTQILMGHHNPVIETGDKVIVMLLDKQKIRQVEQLFQESNLSFV